MDIREMVRRLRKRQSRRAIAKALNVNRKTVRRYRVWAQEHGLLEGNLPSLPDLLTLGDFGLKPLQFCPHCLRLRQRSGPVSNYVYVREVATPPVGQRWASMTSNLSSGCALQEECPEEQRPVPARGAVGVLTIPGDSPY